MLLKRLKKAVALLLLLLVAASLLPVNAFADTNIIENGDFEMSLEDWEEYTWNNGVTDFFTDDVVKYSGDYSLCIQSFEANDARVIQNITVVPNTYYTVTAWVKTSGIPASDSENYRIGAAISIMDTQFVSYNVTGTCDWQQITFSFRAARNMRNVELCFMLGGYGALNMGIAWFDDIRVTSSTLAVPGAYELPVEETEKNEGKEESSYWDRFTLKENHAAIKWMAFSFVWFLVLSILLIAFAETGDIGSTDQKVRKVFFIILAAAFLFRVLVALFSPSHQTDLVCFIYWGGHASADLFNMYSPDSGISFLDYPPFLMYVLAPIGAVANGLYNVAGGSISAMIIKLPNMISDILTAYLLYRLAKPRLGIKWAAVVGSLYALNPAIWINSAGWGQVDSLFTLLVVLEIYCVVAKKWYGAGIAFACSVLMKPHGIIFTPMLGMAMLMELIRNKDIKPFLKTIAGGLATVVLILLPFYIRMNFENPMWIIELYTGTLEQYAYATMNAFNLWALLGFNTTNVNNVFNGLTFAQWGIIGIGFAIALTVAISILGTRKKSLEKAAVPAINGLILIVTVFTLAHKMHERYMFAAVALALMAFVLTKEKWYLYLFELFSFCVFANTYMCYNIYIMYEWHYPDTEDIWITVISAVEVMSFVLLLAITVKNVVFNKLSKPKSLRAEDTENNKEAIS